MKTTDIDKFEAYIRRQYGSVPLVLNDGEMSSISYDRLIYDIDYSSSTIMYTFVSGAKEWKPEVEKKPEEAPKCPYKEIIESLSEYPDKFTKALKAFRDELTKD